MGNFLEELHKTGNKSARTANGAVSNNSTLDALLDFFSKAGAMRDNQNDAVKLFKKAYSVDPTNAVRCLFYLRDIRGGQGERSTFNTILDTLDQDTQKKIYGFIPEYGRWDEIPVNENTQGVLYEQFTRDEEDMKAGKSISLLAKWLPSENATNKEGMLKAAKLKKFWKLSDRKYRKRVSALRSYLGILEQKMSAKQWSTIDYAKLPSQAHRKHVQAFKRNDNERYEQYLANVEKGEAKINSSTLFTYEIYDMVNGSNVTKDQIRTANAMWKALPDYTNDSDALVMADVSGSMSGRPISISTSLAVYFAERNKGLFKNTYMTFTDQPALVEVVGENIKDKLDYVQTTRVGYSTNLQAAFDAILSAAKRSNATQGDMPKVLYIISDMQFDGQEFNDRTRNDDETNFETAARKFQENGYELPHIVFWNVNAYGEDAPATKYDNKVTLISGSSQSTFQYVVAGKTPLQSMMDVLNSERYAKIVL